MTVKTWTSDADTYSTLMEAEDLRPEILEYAETISDGFFPEGERVEWDRFWDHLDGMTLSDGTRLDLGHLAASPLMRKVKRHVTTLRKGQ